ncbi:MAG: PAS domain S-box protein [Magnetococcales bacterium]|nr:PAS domain S-box protein [Magnetococcales bacterium]
MDPNLNKKPKKELVRVFLVDDQKITEVLIRRMLESQPGFELFYCQNPEEALEQAREVDPAVVLMDMVMPGMDGLELLRHFRGVAGMRRVPIIMLTVRDNPTLKAQCFSLGANDYLIKLPDQVEMIARLRHHTSLYLARQHHRSLETRLKASEERYRNLFQHSQDAIFLIHGETDEIIDANQAAARLMKRPLEELIGRLQVDLYPPEEAEQYRDLLRNQPYQGRQFNREFKIVRPNGAKVPVDVSSTVFSIGDDRLVQGIFRDISERKQIETSLSKALHLLGESEIQLQSILDNAMVLVCLKDLDGRYLLINKQFEKRFSVNRELAVGRKASDLFGQGIAEIIEDLDREVVRKMDHIQTEQTFAFEEETLTFISNSFPMIDISGNLFGICRISMDITPRKQMEEMLRISRDGLTQAQKVAQVGSYEWDIPSDRLVWSEESFRILDVTPETAPQSCEHFCNTIPEAERSLFSEALEAAMAPDGGKLDIVHRMDGGGESGERVIYQLGEVVRDEAGKPLRMVGTIQDITRRHRLEEENRRNSLLLIQQSRLAAMGEMISYIAHQWRQPINALSLILANLNDAFQFGDLTAELMTEQEAKGRSIIEKMSSTIDDFRHFFRPNKERVLFEPDRVVAHTLSLVDIAFSQHGILLRYLPPTEAIHAYGFPNEFSQVMLVLLTNARDVLQETAREDPEVVIRLLEDERGAVVIVRDNGGGVDPDSVERIFEPYFTTKSEKQGTGIGLYMAKMIVERQMGGQIEVENIDDGAEFRVILPRVQGSSER